MTWRSGEQVIVRGMDWRVLRNTPFSDCSALDLAAIRSSVRRTLLVPFDRPRAAAAPRLRVVSRRRWAHAVRSLVTASFSYGSLQSCPPGIRLVPYQLEPALAMLRHGAVRLLVADDVGLGKTIEAGLIVREVAKSDQLSRTLIVVPSALREQWAEELRTLFELQTVSADAIWLRRAVRELPRGVNPWSVPGIYVASMDFVKRPEALHPLEDLRWDLLVVDEAHAATPQSDRRAAVHALACRARRVVLLTATPHSGDDEQFDQLCAIGSRGDSAPLVVFSRSRADTRPAGRPPRSTVLSVRPTDRERLMHRRLEEYTARIWTESQRRKDSGSELLATVLRKRALSSARSLALSLRRRLELLRDVAAPASQIALPFHPLHEDGDVDEREDADGRALAGRGLENTQDERKMAEAVAEAAERAAEDESKLRALVRLLGRLREPAIVFSEYRDTAEHLRLELSARGHRVCVLHGGLRPDERRSAVSAFCAGGSLLVATDAASEGLNLHNACRTVIHFELPWTPSRLHQRCGRVNRLGQTRRVHEIALVANDTAEQLVLQPLMQRAARSGAFSRTPIVGQFPEARVAAHILGGTALTPAAVAERGCYRQMPLHDEAVREADRIQLHRRIEARAPGSHPTSSRRRPEVPIARVQHVRPRPGPRGQLLTCIIELTLSEAGGHVCAREPVGVTFDVAGIDWPRRAADLRARLEAFLGRDRARLEDVIAPMLTDRISAARALHAPALAARRRRHLEINADLRSTARELVQAGLFDRRAMRAASERSRRAAMLEEDELARGATMTRSEPGIEGSFSVRAVWCGA
jgi:superfamily II DNA or RNA helicase